MARPDSDLRTGLPNKSRQPMPVDHHDCIRTPSARHGCAFRSARTWGAFCMVHFLAVFISLFSIACDRSSTVSEKVPTQDRKESLEEKVLALQRKVDDRFARTGSIRRSTFHEDLAELNQMGLVERAWQDFSTRMTNASIEQWTIGYGMDTNFVLCDFQYRLPGDATAKRWPFVYSRTNVTNWSLNWRPESPYLKDRDRGWDF